MKTLVIADNDEIVKDILCTLDKKGMDSIVYRWLLKALDNLEEISPDLIIISAFEYPRHWKTLVQFCKSGITRKIPVFILYRQEEISEEELNKEKALGVYGVFYDSKSSELENLLSQLQNEAPAAEVSTPVANISSSSANKSDALEDCKLPTVMDILTTHTEETFLPTVDNLFMLEGIELPEQAFEIINEAPAEVLSADLPEVISEELTEDNEVAELNDSEDSCKLPTVDSLIKDSSVFPTVDTLIQEFQPSLVSMGETVIPSVDCVFDKIKAKRRRPSLLAKIEELYG